MRDIKFSCLNCGQHLIIDARCAGRWVKCTECGTEFQVPFNSPVLSARGPSLMAMIQRQALLLFLATCPLAMMIKQRGLRIRQWASAQTISPRVMPHLLLAPLWSVVLWLGCAKPLMESGLPPLPPWKEMQRAEALLIETNYTQAAESLTVLLVDFPRSKEAQTIRGLLRLVRAKGTSAPGESFDCCTGRDARLIRHQRDIKEALLAFYANLPEERRAVFDSLFGPKTFLQPDLGLAGILFTLQQVEATQALARREATFSLAGRQLRDAGCSD